MNTSQYYESSYYTGEQIFWSFAKHIVLGHQYKNIQSLQEPDFNGFKQQKLRKHQVFSFLKVYQVISWCFSK